MTELLPELHDAIDDTGSFKMIRSAFVNTLYDEGSNDFYNRLHLQNSERFRDLVAKGRYELAIGLVEGPFKLKMLLNICEYSDLEFESSKYWNMLFAAYRVTEYTYDNKEAWLSLMEGAMECRESFMSEADLESYKSLPETFVVYRGAVAGENEDGISYSLCSSQAEWFSKRLTDSGSVLIKGEVHKKDVIGYSNQRGENEIIVSPDNVKILKRYELDYEKAPEMDIKSKLVLSNANEISSKYCKLTQQKLSASKLNPPKLK
ncbi:hypothetical protein [Vibrio sp. D431a]|uniref:hypothetical protein n=1 Tax=Vibrio sp. D431a TaxID=2837388 RepID=UPI002555865D|nr:hypothetical protein [Vibrio sp. D431a]MDK9789978.1 hypothetical protein [Vibrio sp. D431a]